MSSPHAGKRRTLAAAVVLLTPPLFVLLPAILVLMAVVDLAIGARRLPRARFLGMAANYLALEWAGVVAAIGLWFATGFGRENERPWSQAAHHHVQLWWANSIARAANTWLGLRFDTSAVEVDTEKPLVILSQHASILDAIIPTLLLTDSSDLGPARHVLKRELALDPCLGTYGSRLRNHFVSRAGGDDAELACIEALAATADREPLVIFPEGTFHSPARALRAYSRLATTAPERVRDGPLGNLLPVRPGGFTALLRGRPESSLVFVAHVGMESFGSLRAIAENIPFTEPVVIRTWQTPANDVPATAEEQLTLVDERWRAMDAWITEARPNR